MIDTSRMSFLGRGLERLRSSTISVIGCGGGGSHIAQQLAHLAIGTLVLVDGDRLDASNVNRVVGVSYKDVGELKADLLKRRFSNLGGEIVAVPSRAELSDGRRWIEGSDLVLGSVDGARARNNIEYLCRNALVPYIDIGLKIMVDEEHRATAIGGQVFTSLVGGPCMQCVGIITEHALAADRQEYVAGAPDQQVISMNGILASQAVTAAIALLTNYAPGFAVPPLIRYDGFEHSLKPDDHVPSTCPHYCLGDAGWNVVL